MTERYRLVDVGGESVLDVTLPAWAGRGACVTDPPGQLLDDFFVEESHQDVTEQTLKAKRICAGCSVRPECLGWAMEIEGRTKCRDGTFGGLSPSERRFAEQAPDPIAFGLAVLDEQVRLGIVTTPVDVWRRRDGQAGIGSER
jgi:hypothetical protein